MTGEARPTGREKPGEHWNARIIREQAEAPKGKHHATSHRTCARCSGYIDAASGFYELIRHGPATARQVRWGQPGSPVPALYFDGLDCLAAYASAQDEAFPVRERKQIVAPYTLRYCDWCKDCKHLSNPPVQYESCNHPECQCWCVT